MHDTRQTPRRSRPHDLRYAAGVTLIVGLCGVAAVAIAALIAGSFGEVAGRVLASSCAAWLCTLSAMVGAAAPVQGRGDRRPILGQATVALSGIDLGLALLLTWSVSAGQFFTRSLVVTTVLLIACAHACLTLGLGRAQQDAAVRALRRLAVVLAWSAALLISGLAIFVTGSVDAGVWRLLGVLVVLAVLATLLVPVARLITDRQRPGVAPDAGEGSPVPDGVNRSLMRSWTGHRRPPIAGSGT